MQVLKHLPLPKKSLLLETGLNNNADLNTVALNTGITVAAKPESRELPRSQEKTVLHKNQEKTVLRKNQGNHYLSRTARLFRSKLILVCNNNVMQGIFSVRQESVLM